MSTNETWRFGRFTLDAAGRTLQEEGQPVALGARAFDLLANLVARAGDLVTKRELLGLVWPGLVVEENNLQVQVSTLRKLLGASALATIPGRGYRFDLPVARGDAPTGRRARRNEVASAAPRPCPTNLPGRLPPLYGRAGDVAAIQAAAAQARDRHDRRRRRHRQDTRRAGGGHGRRQQRCADDYPDGVWWVELAALTDATLVPATVAHALGAQLARRSSAIRGAVVAPRAATMLLVLDNCEHLSDAVAPLVETLRVRAPGVSVLVTSQETLKVTEEHVYRVGPLAVPRRRHGGCGALRRRRAVRGARAGGRSATSR